MIKSQRKYTFALQTFVCICVLALTTLAAADSPAPKTISGRVIAADGQQPPIEGAVVRLEDWQSQRFPRHAGRPPIVTAITGKDGSFVLPVGSAKKDLFISGVVKGYATNIYHTSTDRLMRQ